MYNYFRNLVLSEDEMGIFESEARTLLLLFSFSDALMAACVLFAPNCALTGMWLRLISDCLLVLLETLLKGNRHFVVTSFLLALRVIIAGVLLGDVLSMLSFCFWRLVVGTPQVSFLDSFLLKLIGKDDTFVTDSFVWVLVTVDFLRAANINNRFNLMNNMSTVFGKQIKSITLPYLNQISKNTMVA